MGVALRAFMHPQPRRHVRSRRSRRGVTLIEVLIVVAILSLIATGVAVAVLPVWGETEIKLTRTDALKLRQAVLQWRFTHQGDCPDTATLVRDHILDAASHQVDAWKQPYKIECEGAEVVVSSSGPDRRFGSEDDIVVPEPDRG